MLPFKQLQMILSSVLHQMTIHQKPAIHQLKCFSIVFHTISTNDVEVENKRLTIECRRLARNRKSSTGNSEATF